MLIDGPVWTMKRKRGGEGKGRVRKEGRGQTAQTEVVRHKHQDNTEQKAKAKCGLAFGLIPWVIKESSRIPGFLWGSLCLIMKYPLKQAVTKYDVTAAKVSLSQYL